MSRSFYFDTSALIKLYHQETGTDQVEEIFRQADNVLIISELAGVELYSTLARKVRTGEIAPSVQDEVLRNFEHDCTHRFVIVPLGSSVIQKAKELLQKHGNTYALRTLDALHLGTCLIARAKEEVSFVCADDRLVAIGTFEGLQILNPEGSIETQTEETPKNTGTEGLPSL